MDVRRNADRLTLIYTATPFKIQFWAVYTQAYGGAGVIAPEHAAAKRGHHPFFFWSEKKGGSFAPSGTPLGYVPEKELFVTLKRFNHRKIYSLFTLKASGQSRPSKHGATFKWKSLDTCTLLHWENFLVKNTEKVPTFLVESLLLIIVWGWLSSFNLSVLLSCFSLFFLFYFFSDWEPQGLQRLDLIIVLFQSHFDNDGWWPDAANDG